MSSIRFTMKRRLTLLQKVEAPVYYAEHCAIVTYSDSGHRDWITYLIVVILDSGAKQRALYALILVAQSALLPVFLLLILLGVIGFARNKNFDLPTVLRFIIKDGNRPLL